MLKLEKKPYHLLLAAGILLLVISPFLSAQSQFISMHVNGSSFKVSLSPIFRVLSLIALIIWVLYLLADRLFYSKILTWIHVIITLLTIAVCLTLIITTKDISYSKPRNFEGDSGLAFFQSLSVLTRILIISVPVLLVGQVVFIINLVIGLFKLD